MADEVIATVPSEVLENNAMGIDAVKSSTENLTSAMEIQRESAANLAATITGVSSAYGAAGTRGMDVFRAGFQKTSSDFQSQAVLATNHTKILAGLTAAALGAGDTLSKASKGADSSGLNDFAKQWTDIRKLITETPVGKMSSGVINDVVKSLTKIGLGAPEAAEALKGVMGGLVSFGDSIASGTGQVQEFKNAQLQAAMASGSFGKMMAGVSPDLSNLNDVLLKNTDVFRQSSVELGKAPDQLADYYSQLVKIPGALNAQVAGLTDASKKTTMLTASVNLAAGSARPFADIVADVGEAYSNYGVEGEKALKMTARFSEVASNTGAPLENIRAGLKATALGFKDVADAGDASARQFDSLSNISNKYFQSLRNSGMTTGQSLETIASMTKAVSNLTTVQKAFLSQQTGGSGGLMGAAQIEKQLRDGDTEGVFDKLRDTLLKQMGGNLVSLDDAATSEQAAGQLQKQRQLMTQGPLGSMVKDERDADRLLEAFRKNDSSVIKPLTENSLQAQMSRGDAIQGSTRTIASDLTAALGRTTLNANIVNFKTMEGIFSQRVNSSVAGNESSAQREMRSNITNNQKDAAPNDMLGSLKEMQRKLMQLPSGASAVAGGFMDAIKGGKSDDIEKQKSILEDNIRKARSRNEMTDDTKTQQMVLNAMRSDVPLRGSRLQNSPRLTGAEQGEMNDNNRLSSKEKNVPQLVEVSVKGICIDCGRKTEEGAQARAISPQISTGNR